MQSTSTLIADKTTKHEPLCSLSEAAKIEGFATYQTLNQWSKKNPLPKYRAIIRRSRTEVKLYSIAELKAWHSEVVATIKHPERVGRRYDMTFKGI